MSKKNFSIKVNDMMLKKLKALENLDIEKFLKKDKYFEFILCLSYMTLSKEKIIDKDMKNTDRMDRLTKHVSTIDIDLLFSPTFNRKMPIIHYAKENNNLWILDNIRDSIMHECFVIDEENECLIINNTANDRELSVTIPFNWFVKYAKNDILSKKISNYHTIKGFYYNSKKTNYEYINTKEELYNTIFYKVIITGNKFNVKEIETRIEELFNKLGKVPTDDYKTSFINSKVKIIEILKEEYPNLKVEIYSLKPHKELLKKVRKQTQKYYTNYDLYYEMINKIIKPKSNELLKYIKKIIEHLDTKFDSNKDSYIEQMELINYLLNEKDIKYTNKNEVYQIFQNNLKTLKNIFLNIYGVSTLVINHDNFYNKSFEFLDPQAYRLMAYSKQTYEEFLKLKKPEFIAMLKKKVILFQKEEHLKKCTSEEGINNLTKIIENIKNEIKAMEQKLKYGYFRPYIDKENTKIVNSINNEISYYLDCFEKCNSVEGKNKLIKKLSELIDSLQEYVYGYCDMKEAIRIIRNSFSHIGRLYIGKEQGEDTIIILNDYDNKNSKSGQVLCSLDSLINIINKPLEDRKKLSKRL